MQQATRIADKTAFFFLGELVDQAIRKKSFLRPKTSAPKITLRGVSVKTLDKRRKKIYTMSIRNKYESELNVVFSKLVKMCHGAELAIEKSITALTERNSDLAREVMNEDKDIDAAERDIEQDCLKILLMEHPVASDFREISATLKMITDLERIGDHAVNIGEWVEYAVTGYHKAGTVVQVPIKAGFVVSLEKNTKFYTTAFIV